MTTEDLPIIVAQTFDTPVEKVWQALTDESQMRQWFFKEIESFKPEVGFETNFNVNVGERDFLHIWKVMEVVPLKKITYSWKYAGYAGNFLSIFELLQQGNQTMLRLTCEIREDFPQEIPEFSRESGLKGWEYFIKQNLKQYLEIR